MATRVTHEATHVRLTDAYYREEPIAWDHALNMYGSLRATVGQSAFYEPYFNARQQNPAGFNYSICIAAGGGANC
jgi:hypothetical protein